MGAHEHEEDEDEPCYRHPDRLTALSCITCGRPICTECAVAAPVGFKCPDDAKQSRAALAKIPASRMAVGIFAGTFVAFVGGTILAILNIPFLGIILAIALGSLVGEVTRRASGGYRDHLMGRVAAVVTALGILVVPVLGWLSNLTDFGNVNVVSVAFTILAAVLGAGAAHNRAS